MHASSVVRAVTRRFGRRGAALLAFGFVDTVVGWSLLDPATQPRGAFAVSAYRAILAIAPYQVWAWAWIGVALACIVGACIRQDAVAFGAAIGIKLVWAGGLLVGWLTYHTYRGWVAAATWFVLAALVAVIAGWPEPPAVVPPVAAPPGQKP